MDLGLAGAKALVQGGTKGMGRAAAECFAADGASVAVLARTQAAPLLRKDVDLVLDVLSAAGDAVPPLLPALAETALTTLEGT